MLDINEMIFLHNLLQGVLHPTRRIIWFNLDDIVPSVLRCAVLHLQLPHLGVGHDPTQHHHVTEPPEGGFGLKIRRILKLQITERFRCRWLLVMVLNRLCVQYNHDD